MPETIDISAAVDAYLNTPARLGAQARLTMSTALSSKPDYEAELRSVAQKTGVPVDTVRAYPDEMRKQATLGAYDFDHMAEQFPTTTRLLADPERAAISHDDSSVLSGIEKVARYIVSAPGAPYGGLAQAGRAIVSGAPRFSSGMYGAVAGVAGVADQIVQSVDDAAAFVTRTPRRQIVGTPGPEGFLLDQQRTAQGVARDVLGMRDDAGMVERAAMSGLQSAGQSLLIAPLGVAQGAAGAGVNVVLGLMGMSTAGESYGKARAAGLGPLKSAALGLEDGTAEIVTEKYLGIAGFLKNVKAGATAGKLFSYEVLREIPGEIGATVWQNFNEWAVINPTKPIAEFVKEQPQAIAETIIATIVGGGAQIGAVRGVDRFARDQAAGTQSANHADTQGQALDALADLAKQSKLRERAPDAFQQFVKDATQGGPLQDVFISAQTLNQSGMGDRLAAISPSVAEQLPGAIESGGDVRIPVEEFAARIAGTDLAPALLSELKTEAGGMTRTEAAAFRQSQGTDALDEMALLAAEQPDDITLAEQGKAIQMDMAAKLNEAGRFSPAVNHAYSQLPRAFFETMASRLGGSPAQLYAEYAPRIAVQGVTGSPMLSQDELGGFVPREFTQDGKAVIGLFKGANLSTYLHESGHYFLESFAHMAKDAPALQGDMQTLLDSFGVKDLATWQAMSLEDKRTHHEQFARGFEAYLAEGTAPSLELRSVFARFRDWLVSVYRNIKHLNVELSDDVRAVMDRMLATDAHIQEAQRARGMAPIFTSPGQAGEFGVNWNDYQALGNEATAIAVGTMEARSIRDMTWTAKFREETIKRLNKDAKSKRAEIMGEVAAEVMLDPVYQVQRWIKKGVLPDGTQSVGAKLSTSALAEMYGDGPATPRRYLATNLVAADGLHPDVVAEMFGFPSGDAMVRQVVDALPFRAQVEALTDQRMLEVHGDLMSPAAVAKAADQAIHNDVRTRFLATELAGLQKAVGGARVVAQMAKEYAARMIERTPAGKIRPAQYAAAEVRAGKAAEAALKQGDTAEAIKQKRFQIINHTATRAAYEAQAEVDKAAALFRTVAAGGDAKLRNMDIVNAARAILAEYGVGMRGKNPRAYMEAVKEYDPELYAVLEPMLLDAESGAKPVDELTVGQLRALRDNIESLWYLARRERQVEIDGELVDREAVSEALTGRLDALGVPEVVPGEGRAVTESEKTMRYLMGARAALRRTESWAGRMDGGKIDGAFRKFIFTPISEAADRYRTDAGAYLKQYRDLLKNIEPTLTRGRIAAPELGYTFGHSQGDAGKAELLHAILHTGNESNKRKLLLGRGWAQETAEGVLDTSRWDAFTRRMMDEGKLTKADFGFAQGVWDLLERIKPLAQKTHRDVFGRYFDEITATEFANQFGTYRGGYVPAITDTFEVQDAAINAELDAVNQGNAFMFPATSRGFTKARVEYNKPLALDLRLVPQHIDKALLFSHLEPHVRDVTRTLRAKAVANKLNRYDPVAYSDLLLPWLNRASKQTVETPATGWGGKLTDRFFRTVRTRAGMAAMFANTTNALQQITGLSITALRVKPSHLADATWRYIRSPNEVAAQVAELSPFMANRQANEVMQMRQQVEDLLLNPNEYEKVKAFSAKHAYFLQSAFQNVVDNITWAAAFDQANAEGLAHLDAVRSANAAVRETQGSLSPEDISRFESGAAFTRMFTQFSGYFNMQANLLGSEFAKVSQDMGLKAGAGRLFYVFLFGFLVPAWFSEAIVLAMRGGPDDENKNGYLDEFLAFFFGAPLRGAAAMVPVVGQASVLAANTFNNKPYDDRMSTAPAVSMIENAVKAPSSIYRAVVEDGKASRAIRDTLTLVSLMTGIPVAALGKPLGYAADVAQDRVVPTGPADMARGLVSGAASPDSKR